MLFLNQAKARVEKFQSASDGSDVSYLPITATDDGDILDAYHSIVLEVAELKFYSYLSKTAALWHSYKTETKNVNKSEVRKNLKDVVIDLTISTKAGLIKLFPVASLERS